MGRAQRQLARVARPAAKISRKVRPVTGASLTAHEEGLVMARRKTQTLALVAVVALLVPAGVSAQQAGAIAGVVRDTTGGVLPGVAVEASSPALIEKVRVVTTDDAGQYRIVDLRPGVYSVTFALPGFSTVRRDGIELSAGFTANVTVELRVGDVAETVTVSGASPVVDVQNVNQQRVMTREVLDTIPSGRTYSSLEVLIPGVVASSSAGALNHDVGGMSGMPISQLSQIHGGRQQDHVQHVNGMSIASITSQGNSRSVLQDGQIEEYVMQYASAPAETSYGGIYVNMIPKQGGNVFHGALFAAGTAEALQATNLDEDLRSRGLTVASTIKRTIEVNPSFGGPITRDRVWFFAAFRNFVSDNYVPGLYLNKDPRAWQYVPDTSRRAVADQRGKNASMNLTWQASPKNKFTGFYSYDFQCYCHFGIQPTLSAEAAHLMKARNNLYQGTWTSPVTNRLLVEAGVSRYFEELPRDEEPDAFEPSIVEQSTGLRFRGQASYPRNDGVIDHYRAALSYVTGAHAFKIGVQYEHQFAEDTDRNMGGVNYRTLNGVPNQVTYFTLPYAWQMTMEPLALFVQDQWTLRRWTINAGLRYDQFRSSYPDTHVDPTRWLPVARDYPGAEVFNMKDLSPRFGVSWDLFGNGKTAVKATLNRYVLQEGKTQTNQVHPVIAATNTIARTWTDANRDFVVQGDPFNPEANAELGASPNRNFGRPVTTLQFDPDWSRGFGTRSYNLETSAGVQHEVMPGLSVTASYFRRIYGNFIVTDNVLVSPSDYDPYCITAPSDPRLPGGGGQQICGLFDLSPAKVGQVQNLRTYSGKYGDQYEHWNGVDITMNARLPRNVFVQGGVSTGKLVTDNCDLVPKIDNPSPYQCHRESPYLAQVKFIGSYPLPWWGIQLSGAFQRLRPDPTGGYNTLIMGMSAQYVATNAVIAPSLGRNLSAGAGANATIELLEPGLFLDTLNQLDVRLAKTFTVGGAKLQGLFDVFNLFNANPVLRYNTAYGTNGANWLVPQAALPARLIRLGVQATF
jgi:hypothetical protein